MYIRTLTEFMNYEHVSHILNRSASLFKLSRVEKVRLLACLLYIYGLNQGRYYPVLSEGISQESSKESAFYRQHAHRNHRL